MRRQKRRILVDEATSDTEKLQTDQIKLQMLRQEYARFSKAAKLRTQGERAETAGFGWKQAKETDRKHLKSILLCGIMRMTPLLLRMTGRTRDTSAYQKTLRRMRSLIQFRSAALNGIGHFMTRMGAYADK